MATVKDYSPSSQFAGICEVCGNNVVVAPPQLDDIDDYRRYCSDKTGEHRADGCHTADMKSRDAKDEYTHRELLTKLAIMANALSFYADPTTYHALTVLSDSPCGPFVYDVDHTHKDLNYNRPVFGAKARSAMRSVGDELFSVFRTLNTERKRKIKSKKLELPSMPSVFDAEAQKTSVTVPLFVTTIKGDTFVGYRTGSGHWKRFGNTDPKEDTLLDADILTWDYCERYLPNTGG